MVVDATFGHRIAESERPTYEEAVLAGELVSPPAGAIGRGDAFVLSIASRADATVFSNDSFQEFHGQYTWLFDEGRLIGGKPIPGVGWVFVLRSPVRGVASRRSTQRATRGDARRPRSPRRRSRRPEVAPRRRRRRDGDRPQGRRRSRAQTPTQPADAGSRRAGAAKPGGRPRAAAAAAAPRTGQRPARVPRVREPPPGRVRGGRDGRPLLVARCVRRRRRRAVLPAAAPHGRSAPEERQGAALGGRHPFLRGGVVRLAAQEHRPGDTRARDHPRPQGRNPGNHPPPRRHQAWQHRGRPPRRRRPRPSGPPPRRRRRPRSPRPARPRRSGHPAKKKAAKKKAPARKKAAAKKTTARKKTHGQAGAAKKKATAEEGAGQEEVRRRGARRPRSAEPSASGGDRPPDALERHALDPAARRYRRRRAHRHLERQLPERAPAAGRGVARLRAARRAVPPGDQARRHRVPGDGLPGPRLRERAPRRGPVERRRHPEPRRPRRRRRGLHRRARAGLRRPPAVGDVRRRAGRQRLRAERPLARATTTTSTSSTGSTGCGRTSTRHCDPSSPLAICGDYNIAPTDEDVWDPAGVRRLDPRERAGAQGARGTSRTGASTTRSAGTGPSPGSTRTGTTGPACSTSTRACGST